MGYIVDLSEHNTITDWSKASKEIDLAILRIGFRGSIEGKAAYKKITLDGKFESHLAGCKKYNIPYAIYYFPTPITDEEAVEEAVWLINKLKNLNYTLPVFIDSENVLSDRKGRADQLSKSKRSHLLRVITDRLLADGIPCGIYSYTSWLAKDIDLSQLEQQVVNNTWVAQNPLLTYKGKVAMWQYGTKKFSWATNVIDVNKIVGEFDYSAKNNKKEQEDKKMASYYRQTIVDKAKSYLGVSTGSAKHKEIVNKYNTQKSLPRGYKMTYKDPWCATFVSAIAMMCGYTDIIPTECSCGFMVDKAKKMGIWQEKDNYVPKPGDIIMYDWDDNGKGDCTGWPDHTGFVETSYNGSFTTIEGNSGNGAGIVRRSNLKVDQVKIRGFICPKYTAEKAPSSKTTIKKIPLTIDLPELHLGDKNETVKLWQWLIGCNVTGVFDDATVEATRAWQKKNGKTVDGWVGKGCWTKVFQLKGWL